MVANDFSYIELRMIQSLALKESFAHIADILERSIDEISEVITDMFKRSGEKPFEFLLREKLSKKQDKTTAIQKVNKAKRAKKFLEALNKKQTKAAVVRTTAMLKQPEKKYATRVVDFKQMVSIRIDHKTTIYIKPGEDPDAARAAYLKRLNASRDLHIEQSKDYKEVKKFK